MSFDWNDQQSQYEQAPLIPEGRAWVRIKSVRHGSKNGGLFTTKAGDPKMLIIFEDAHGNEGSDMISLSPQAAFRVKALLEACHDPFDFDKMNADGVTPRSFADTEFATVNLVDRHCWMNVSHTQSQNGKTYLDVEYVVDDAIDRIESAADPAKAGAADSGGINPDDIPF
jgi:hypothetical protein